MIVLSVILFALSTNLDNIAIGISYGIKHVKIPMYSNVVIASISTIGTILSMIFGKVIFMFLPEEIGNLIGSIILIFIGGYYVAKYFYDKYIRKIRSGFASEDPDKYDKDNSGDIIVKEAVLLGLALTINNIGLGVGASVSGLPMVSIGIAVFIFSLVTIVLGNLLGNSFFSKVIGRYAEPISGGIIMILAIVECIF